MINPCPCLNGQLAGLSTPGANSGGGELKMLLLLLLLLLV